MSDLAKTVRGILAADSDVTGVVSTRISALFREEGYALPAVIIDVDGVEPDEARGLSGVASMIRGDITVSCLAETISTAVDLAQKCATALGAQTGTNADGKAYSVAASVSSDSVARAIDGTGAGPITIDCDVEVFLEV